MAVSNDAYALSRIFTPEPSCSPGVFDQLIYRQSLIYLNYPNPLPASTQTGCYPSQFLSSYLTQQTVVTPLPPLAPLVCPSGYTTATIDYAPEVPPGYIACCPSEYELAGPSPPWPPKRPAYNATCRSSATSVLITPYATNFALPVVTWLGTADDHVYALPLEGYVSATTSPTSAAKVGSPTPSMQQPSSMRSPSSTAQSSDASSSAPAPSATTLSTDASSKGHSKHPAGGAIAGIVVGSVVAGIIAFVLCCFLRRVVLRRQARGGPEAAAPVRYGGRTPAEPATEMSRARSELA